MLRSGVRVVGVMAVRALVPVVVLVAAAGCGAAASPSVEQRTEGAGAAPRTTSTLPSGLPPDVVVSGGGTELALTPSSWCWRFGCAEGAPQPPLPDVGSPEEVVVTFPEPGWTFSARFREVTPQELATGERGCGREQSAEARLLQDGGSVLAPVGAAGVYDVALFGRGPEQPGGGSDSVSASFRWTTPSDGPLEATSSYAWVLSEHDGAVDSYGVELGVDGLAQHPSSASATVVVTSAEGRSAAVELPAVEGYCWDAGTVFLTAPRGRALGLVSLGSAPFTYDVALVLDGVEHRARATWPDDAEDGGPVDLVYSPPLPSLPSLRG